MDSKTIFTKTAKGLGEISGKTKALSRDLRNILPQLREARIHRASDIPIYTFGRGFIERIAARLQRRMKLAVSVTERHLYLDVDGESMETVIEEHPVGSI